MDTFILVAGIGVVGGALSGFLGIGGGIITAPLLLYLPSLFRLPPLSMHLVSGLTVTQALFAGLVGAVTHWRYRAVDRRLAASMSATIFAASLIGAAASTHFSHEFLLGVFALLASIAAALLFFAQADVVGKDYRPGAFSTPRAVSVAATVGVLGGLVGQGGSFILIPMMVSLLKVPLRVAMGSNLAIVCFASLAGFIGKAATGQVSTTLAPALLAGVLPGSLLGSHLSQRVPARTLKRVLGGVILIACLRMVFDLVR